MTTFMEKAMRCALLLLVFTVAMLVSMAMPAQAANKKEEKKKETPQYTVSGRDPKAFVDAAAMFKPSSQMQMYDLIAKAVLENLGTAVKKSDPWSPKLWVQLDRLRAVRISSQLVGELRHTAQKMVVQKRTPSRSKVAAAKLAFEQGNRQYETGRFNKAIESYRMAMEDHPAFWDAWNNMALAEIHNNNDLVALFLLSALTKNNHKYTGASINLSVCLERLGHNVAAYDIAASIAKEHSQMPMAQYNMAWFENSRGKYESANIHLSKAMEKVSDYAGAKWLETVNSMESGRSISTDELKTLPTDDQSQGTPKIVNRPVKVAMADAYSGNAVAAKIPKGSQLVISEKTGDWNAFYWPIDNVKRRLWIHKASFGTEAVVVNRDIKSPAILIMEYSMKFPKVMSSN